MGVWGIAAQAAPCASVSACVEAARRTPAEFTPTLQKHLEALSTDAVLAGLSYENPQVALATRVRQLAIGETWSRKLSEAQLAALFARYTSVSFEEAETLRSTIEKQPRGKALLAGYLRTHDDDRALRIAWELAPDERAPAADRARARALVWARYLRERQTRTAEHDSLLNFMANRPQDFAALARALVLDDLGKGRPPLYDDLDLMSRQPTLAVIVELLGWAPVHAAAQSALLFAIQRAPEPALQALRTTHLPKVEAALLAATTGREIPARVQGLAAWTRLFAPPLAASAPLRAQLVAAVGDPEPRVRELAYRSIGQRLDDAAVRDAVLSGVWRWDRDAVRVVAHDPKDKLTGWRRNAVITVLRSLPDAQWLDPSWQHELAFIGMQLQRETGRKAGFEAFGNEFVGVCGNTFLDANRISGDLQLLDPKAYEAWKQSQPKSPTPEEQAATNRERAAQLKAARDKLLATLRP